MILYHYTSGQGFKGIIESKQLHCTNIHFLNDPSENKYHFEVLHSVLDENSKCHTIYNKFHDKVFDRCFYDSDNIFLLSFCESRDSLTMWKYYAKGNGYCIGFDWNKIFERNKCPHLEMTQCRVIYDKEEQKKAMRELILSFEERLSEVEGICTDGTDGMHKERQKIKLEQDFNLALLDNSHKYKHSAFVDENEFRIGLKISDYANFKNLIGHKNSEGGTIVSYLTLNIEPCEDIVSILCHPRSKDVDFKGIELFIKHNEMKYCTLEKSEIPFREI